MWDFRGFHCLVNMAEFSVDSEKWLLIIKGLKISSVPFRDNCE